MCMLNIRYSVMERDYHKVTSEIDAREILRYLNNLGIHNISGEVLKYFISDLKKLIKYDLENQYEATDSHETGRAPPGPERLHSASTFSSRVRSKTHNGPVSMCTRECQSKRRVLVERNIRSTPNLVHHTEENPLKRACSCVRVGKRSESQSSAKDKVTVSSNNNLIKVPIQTAKKKCDPVSLYHHYTSLWAKYKPNVPGENDWADLRWKIRQKMAGSMPHQGSEVQAQNKQTGTSKNRL